MASNYTLDLKERYTACMVLHAVGDAMGYRNGKWEFNKSGEDIHRQVNEMGGVENIKFDKKWLVSDDTILHLANADFLISHPDASTRSKETYLSLIDYYKRAMRNMADRAPGPTTINAVNSLSKNKPDGFRIPFNPSGGGCGASMRSSCIGLRYSKQEEIDDLIIFSIESGRMTHHHPIGYLGGVVSALFTSYALQGKPVENWGCEMLIDLDKALKYIKSSGVFVKENVDSWSSFVDRWVYYLNVRKISTKNSEPVFPDKYDAKERELFYKSITGGSWPGSNGYDSVIIAYDGLLGCKGSWRELCLRAVLHGGDNDSTGCIAGSWFGALYGFNGIPLQNYKDLEYHERIKDCAIGLFNLTNEKRD